MGVLGNKAILTAVGVALLSSCATPATIMTPQQRKADMVVVGRVTGFGERDVDFISGGIDVTLIEGRTVTLDRADKPGQKIVFASELPCPADKVGDQLYLVYLQWVQFPTWVGFQATACTPIDPATSVGIAN